MQTNVLIVGGGLSGLALADHLHRRGEDWLLVEARDRLGGRILSPEIAGARFDLGPAWFWPGQFRLEQLASRFNLPVFEQYSDGATVFQDRSGAVQKHHGYASMQGSFRIEGGIGRLIEGFADTLPKDRMKLDCPVIKIIRTADGIEVKAESQTIATRRVVLAIPPRIASRNITFEPGFGPEVHVALDNIPTWMAGHAKIMAIYDRPHWRETGLSGDGMSQRGPMVEIHDASPDASGRYALFGFLGVEPAVRFQHRDEVLQLAVEQLVDMFGSVMAKPVAIKMFDWASEPETATSLDHTSPRFHPTYGLPDSLTNLWNGRLVLGSTETAPGFGGFLEGALEAAERVEKTLSAVHDKEPV